MPFVQVGVAEARASVAEARAAVESGAHFARERSHRLAQGFAQDASALLGGTLQAAGLTSMTKLSLGGWSDVKRTASKAHAKAKAASAPFGDATNRASTAAASTGSD